MASKSLKRFRGRLIFCLLFLGVVEGRFCWGFREFWGAERGFFVVRLWWICGENVAGNDSRLTAQNFPLF
jgi:hypothetical protein